MGKPLFTFGQPQVKWTEIDDSIVLPIHQNQEKNTLVLIDSEWGEPNKLEYITDSQTYVEKFGKLIDPLKSQKGYDYLPHYLQGNLQGNIPMYVMRVGYPDSGSTIDDYKQMTTYEIENSNSEIDELLLIKQKYQGLFGKDFGIKVYYNSLFKMYSIDVINMISYVEQSENDESEIEILESFKEKSFRDLIDKVNNQSKYVEINFYKIEEGIEEVQVLDEDLSSAVTGQTQTFTLQNTDIVENSVEITMDLDEILSITGETPTGDVDGQNQTYTLQENNVDPSSLSITLTEYTEYLDETPTGDVDGQNQTYTLQNTNVNPTSFELTIETDENITTETPTGDIDSSNMTYTLQNTNIIPGSFSVVVDGGSQITDTDNGDGTGDLSDTGSITYQTGEFTLNQQPTTTVVQDYDYTNVEVITDTDDGDGTGTLSDAGHITYQTGEFTLNQQPQVGQTLSQDYETVQETQITDDGSNSLSDGGTVDYTAGEFTLNQQPQTGSDIIQDYDYNDVEVITDNGSGDLSDGGTINYQTGEFTLNENPTLALTVEYSYYNSFEYSTNFEHYLNNKYDVFSNVDITQPTTESITTETPTGSINSTNTEYTLQNSPVFPGSFSVVVDGGSQITDTDNGDGTGELSDGGSITYSTGTFTLDQQPTTTVVQDYNYSTINTLDVQHNDLVRLHGQTNQQENGLYRWSSITSELSLVGEDFTTTQLYSLIQNDSYVIDFAMQYKDISDDIIPRVKQQDQTSYYDGVTDSIIKDNLSQTTFNEQASLEVDFQEQLNGLVQNYEVTSPEFGNLRYIQTLGLQKHSMFTDTEHEFFSEYYQFLNNIYSNIIQPRRNVVLISEPMDYTDSDQVTDQLTFSGNVWSDLKGSYISLYFPWILEKRAQLDLHLPPSFDVIQKLYQWEPNLQIQGIRRGRISESSTTTRVLSDSDKDDLSQDNINSLMYYPHYKGTYIWDEKTHYNKLSQLSRLSQRLIMIEIEERVNREMGFFLFEPLVESTFNRIQQRQDYILSQYRGMNWIYDYQIDLDTSLELLDNHMVILKLLIKPIKNLEFVEIKQFVRSYQNQTAEF